MNWKSNLNRLKKDWPTFSTLGDIHLRGVIVESQGSPNPLSNEAFSSALRGNDHAGPGDTSVKQFYEYASWGQLRFASIEVERFVASGPITTPDDAYRHYFQIAAQQIERFTPRTHFLFALNFKGAVAPHNDYYLKIDAQNLRSLVHEFGHNLGLKHATSPGKDRGDESDRMGAAKGYMEFNAPNMVHLKWLPKHLILDAAEGTHSLLPLEDRTPSLVPRVLRIRHSNQREVYLSVRDRIGPYDSVYLADKYAQKLSIHEYNDEGKTQLSDILDVGASFVWRGSVTISFLSKDTRTGQYRVQIAMPSATHSQP